MIVLSIEQASEKTIGSITRFFCPVRKTLFLGNVPANTREKIWEYIVENDPDCDALMAFDDAVDGGISWKSHGAPSRKIVNYDGLQLVARSLDDRELYNIAWAKIFKNNDSDDTEKTLLDHSIETGLTAKYFLQYTSLRMLVNQLAIDLGTSTENAVNTIAFIVALHDIGKMNPFFQFKESNSECCLRFKKLFADMSNYRSYIKSYRHENIKPAIIENLLAEDGYSRDTIKYMFQIISTHHQKGTSTFGSINVPFSNEWNDAQAKVYKQLEKVFSPGNIVIEYEPDLICSIISGLMQDSDWLASTEKVFGDLNSDMTNYVDAINKRLASCIKENHITPVKYKLTRTIQETFSFTQYWTLHPAQAKLESILNDMVTTSDLILIEDTTGHGKTISGMYAALFLISNQKSNADGIYYALPTAATSIAIQPELTRELQSYDSNFPMVELFTHNAWLYKYRDEDETVHDCLSYLKFLQPFAVGTVDQALTSVLKGKHGVQRLVALLTKVIVIDEFHAYDAFQLEEICMLLRWRQHFHLPTIMLSATLPDETKQKLFNVYSPSPVTMNQGYPLITTVNEGTVSQYSIEDDSSSKDVEIRFLEYREDHSNISNDAVQYIQQYDGCVEIVLNTIDDAIQTYRALKKQHSDIPVILIHSGFPEKQKEKQIQQILNLFGSDASHRPDRYIVIGTQLLEQSLNVDFDYIISALAPIDLIIQRIGRLRRFKDIKRTTKSNKTVFTIISDANCSVYTRYSNKLCEYTKEYLENHSRLTIPDMNRNALNEVYSRADDVRKCNESFSENSADLHLFQAPQKDRFQFYDAKCHGDVKPEHEMTRENCDSIKLCVLDHEQFSVEAYTKEHVIDILYTQTVSIAWWKVKDILNSTNSKHGKGMLGSCILYDKSDGRIYLDEEYGVLVK